MKTRKSFGQHLLTDKNHLDKIVSLISVRQNDTVLEIGSGSGILTIPLAKVAKKIYAIEPERDILKHLYENIKKNNQTNVQIIEKSFLNLDLDELFKIPFKVVGNIPYNITSRILIKLFGEIDEVPKHLNLIDEAFLLMQYEVAERLVAKPGSKAFSPLSLLVQYFTEPVILHKVPKQAFSPPPKVESAFVHFKMKDKLVHVKNPKLLKTLIRTTFQQKRKKISNSISSFFQNKEILEEKLAELNIDKNLRPEDLSFDDYSRISDVIHQ